MYSPTFGTYEFEVVSKFTYLGTFLTNNNDLNPEKDFTY